MVDEVQTGCGGTGYMWYVEWLLILHVHVVQ